MHTKGFTKALWDLFVDDSPQKDFSNIWTWGSFPQGKKTMHKMWGVMLIANQNMKANIQNLN